MAPPPPPPLLEGTFAQANRLKEAAFAGRLKEATRDLGAAHIDSLRTVFAAGVLQTRERLNRLTCSARVERLDSVSDKLGLRGNVRALGLGLLERTEAVLDLLLQLADAESQQIQLGNEDGDEDNRNDASWRERIPRALPIQVLQTFAVRLSESRSVRVTCIGMQDTCSCLAQRLRVDQLWQLLRSVHSWAEEKQKQLTDEQGSSPRVADRAVQIARVGCEKLLPSRVGRFLNGVFLVGLLGHRDREGAQEHNSPELGTRLFVEEIVEEEDDDTSTGGGRTFLAGIGDLGELQSQTGRRIRLVVKNSFIELVEEPSPRERRRARSCEPVLFADLRDASYLDANAPRHPASLPADGSQGSREHLAAHSSSLPAEGSQSSIGFSESCACGPSTQRGPVQDESSTACVPTTADDQNECLTVMLRNVPPQFGRSDLLALLNGLGFSGRYNFVYLPVDFTRNLGLGYALVGLVDHTSASALMQNMHGLSFDGSFQCEASWSEPHRGLEGHMERYRNSPVMHHSMPDDYKPAIFLDGERIAFPPPTKAIRAPRIRHPKAEGKAVASLL